MSTAINEKESARINIRLRPEIKQRIERAASVSGQSVTDFAIRALNVTADEVLKQHEVNELSNRDRDTFIAILDERAAPNDLLKRAKKTHRKLIEAK